MKKKKILQMAIIFGLRLDKCYQSRFGWMDRSHKIKEFFRTPIKDIFGKFFSLFLFIDKNTKTDRNS